MLTSDRVLRELAQQPVKPEWACRPAANVTIYRGAIVAVCQDGTIVPAGAAAPATPASPLVQIMGIADHQHNNPPGCPGTGLCGGPHPVRGRRRPVALPFDVLPTWASVGKPVYAVDDQTVTLTQAASANVNRLQVGVLSGFDLDGTPFVAL